MKLIVGLGNHGEDYKNTRHNIGYIILDKVAEDLEIEINKKKFAGLYGEKKINEEKVILLKPQKYMNLSGEVIKKYVDYFKIEPENILVINDDLDINVGNYKIKASGGSAGHKGLKNIEQNINTKEYGRLKIGISNNKVIDSRSYVLGLFSPEEKTRLKEVIAKSKDIIKDFIIFDISKIMNDYNKKNK